MGSTQRGYYAGTNDNAILGGSTISGARLAGTVCGRQGSLTLTGYLDDVIIWNKALNTEQIDALISSYPSPDVRLFTMRVLVNAHSSCRVTAQP